MTDPSTTGITSRSISAIFGKETLATGLCTSRRGDRPRQAQDASNQTRCAACSLDGEELDGVDLKVITWRQSLSVTRLGLATSLNPVSSCERPLSLRSVRSRPLCYMRAIVNAIIFVQANPWGVATAVLQHYWTCR